jgi:hypothetical protein
MPLSTLVLRPPMRLLLLLLLLLMTLLMLILVLLTLLLVLRARITLLLLLLVLLLRLVRMRPLVVCISSTADELGQAPDDTVKEAHGPMLAGADYIEHRSSEARSSPSSVRGFYTNVERRQPSLDVIAW